MKIAVQSVQNSVQQQMLCGEVAHPSAFRKGRCEHVVHGGLHMVTLPPFAIAHGFQRSHQQASDLHACTRMEGMRGRHVEYLNTCTVGKACTADQHSNNCFST